MVASYLDVDKGQTTFNQKEIQLQPVNPFNLSSPANNAAEFVLTTLDNVVNWVRSASMWPMVYYLLFLLLLYLSFSTF